jgi:hypothetical protein
LVCKIPFANHPALRPLQSQTRCQTANTMIGGQECSINWKCANLGAKRQETIAKDEPKLEHQTEFLLPELVPSLLGKLHSPMFVRIAAQ